MVEGCFNRGTVVTDSDKMCVDIKTVTPLVSLITHSSLVTPPLCSRPSRMAAAPAPPMRLFERLGKGSNKHAQNKLDMGKSEKSPTKK
jgi:hypothetical protein